MSKKQAKIRIGHQNISVQMTVTDINNVRANLQSSDGVFKLTIPTNRYPFLEGGLGALVSIALTSVVQEPEEPEGLILPDKKLILPN